MGSGKTIVCLGSNYTGFKVPDPADLIWWHWFSFLGEDQVDDISVFKV